MIPPTPLTAEHRALTLRGWQWGTADANSNGAAVLLVHGFSDTSTGPRQLFVQAARELVDRGACVRSYDRLGQGMSDGDFLDITIRDEVSQVVTMVESFADAVEAPVHIVAHSLGAVESAIAAARVPTMVASLTLWSPAGVVVDDITVKDEIQGQPLEPVREQGWFDFGGMALGRGFVDDVLDGLDVYAEASGYTGPAHVLHGTADAIVPIEYGRRYADLLTGAAFTAVDGADHGWSSVPVRRTLFDLMNTLIGNSHTAGHHLP